MFCYFFFVIVVASVIISSFYMNLFYQEAQAEGAVMSSKSINTVSDFRVQMSAVMIKLGLGFVKACDDTRETI